MIALSASPLYAAALTALLIVLSARVVQGRNRLRVTLGDGGDGGLYRRIRAQANCAEYAPLGVVLLVMAEMQGAALWAVHLGGITLTVGRFLHAYAVSSNPEPLPLRIAGMAMTFTALAGTAALSLLA